MVTLRPYDSTWRPSCGIYWESVCCGRILFCGLKDKEKDRDKDKAKEKERAKDKDKDKEKAKPKEGDKDKAKDKARESDKKKEKAWHWIVIHLDCSYDPSHNHKLVCNAGDVLGRRVW